MKKLTPAQRDALALLAQHPGKPLEGWKRRTMAEPPPPRVNMRAAHALAVMGLANAHYSQYTSPFTHDTKYSITDAGQEVLDGS